MTAAGDRGGRGGRRLPLVDSLRAIAALSIFAYHALFVTGNLSSTGYGWHLNAGVPLFYAISGLLLFLPFARACIVGGPLPGVGRYAVRRAFRIVPAYWVALPIVAIVLLEAGEVFSPGGIVTYFGFLQLYGLDTLDGGIGQAWTLCVEVTFYAFVPLWGLLCVRSCRAVRSPGARAGLLLALTGALAVLSLLWKVAVVAHVGGDRLAGVVPLLVLPAALDQFAVGMAIAVLLALQGARGDRPTGLGVIARAPWLGIAAAALAYMAMCAVWGIGPGAGARIESWGAREIATHELKAILAGGLVLAAVLARPGEGLVGRCLGIAPLRRVGEVSYGVYLWHLMILVVFAGALSMGSQVEWIGGSEGLIGGWPGVAVALAATIAVSVASWELIERRLIARSHRSAG